MYTLRGNLKNKLNIQTTTGQQMGKYPLIIRNIILGEKEREVGGSPH